MRFHLSAFALALIAPTISVLARPALDQRFMESVLDTDDVVLFDAPAYPNPANPKETLASVQTYVYLRQVDTSPVAALISGLLSQMGVEVGDKLSTLKERIKLIAAIGLPGKEVSVKVTGCSGGGKTQGTATKDIGQALTTLSLGTCGSTGELTAMAGVGLLSKRTIKASVFSTPDSGFGVISDIDDTVKISNSLNTAELIKSTFLDDPKPVPGVPELYTSLSKSLGKPQFFYITASPFQLYPFLNNFLDTTYPSAKGPIFTQNLTIVDIPSAFQFLNNGNIQAYKTSVIDRIKTMYPNKKWLVVGDSTQKDPETYGDAFRKYGQSFSCIWIRKVDGGNNTDARFATAFAGVPQGRFRVFTDGEIPSLSQINVAGGEC